RRASRTVRTRDEVARVAARGTACVPGDHALLVAGRYPPEDQIVVGGPAPRTRSGWKAAFLVTGWEHGVGTHGPDYITSVRRGSIGVVPRMSRKRIDRRTAMVGTGSHLFPIAPGRSPSSRTQPPGGRRGSDRRRLSPSQGLRTTAPRDAPG